MSKQSVPEQDHVSRYCSPKQIDAGTIQASAFILRETEEFLSVNWLEKLCPLNRNGQIEALRNTFRKKYSLRPNGKFVVLNVGAICNKIRAETTDNRELQVTYQPKPEDNSHCSISNLKHDDVLIAELIVETIDESYPAI